MSPPGDCIINNYYGGRFADSCNGVVVFSKFEPRGKTSSILWSTCTCTGYCPNNLLYILDKKILEFIHLMNLLSTWCDVNNFSVMYTKYLSLPMQF